MFDHLISLGFDCEPVVQLRRLTGRNEAHVLDWQKLHQPGLRQVLATDFEGYFELANLVLGEDRDHVLDTATGLEFHHLFPLDLDGRIGPHRIAREYPRMRARQDYLLRRWREIARSSQSVLYVRRDPYDLFTLADVAALRDALRGSYPGHRFAVLWVRSPDARDAGHLGEEIEAIDDALYVAELPVDHPRAVYWRGDDDAWDRLYPRIQRLTPPARLEMHAR